MEFDEMQAIWNTEEQEKQYVINEAILHQFIQEKGRSINRWLAYGDVGMILANLVAGGVLIWDGIVDNAVPFQLVLASMYFVYSVVILIRRVFRKQEEVQFEHSMLGELDKAIWQVTYLIKQARSMIVWYVLPLAIVASIGLFPTKPLFGVAFLAVMATAVLVAHYWEVERCYVPKKRELEALRAKIVEPLAD